MSNLETYLAAQNAQPAVADIITTITKVGIQITRRFEQQSALRGCGVRRIR